MKNKLLSIIVPAYNVEKYLSKTVKSLGVFLNCEEVEIVIINDGSTDCTFRVAKKLGKEYQNIEIIDKKNSGLSAVRNFGNKVAQGEYIYFFDGDDYLNEEYTSEIMNELKKRKFDLYCLGYVKVDAQGRKISSHVYDVDKKYSRVDYVEFIKSLVGDDNEPIAGYLPTKIIRHDLIKNILFKDMNYEDMPFVFELLPHSKISIYYFNELIYNYVQRNNSITHTISAQNMLDKLESLEIVSQLIDQVGVDEKTKYLNDKRSLIAILWVSSLNCHGDRIASVAYKSNLQFKRLPLLLSKHVGVTPYMIVKEIYYFLKNKVIYKRGMLSER